MWAWWILRIRCRWGVRHLLDVSWAIYGHGRSLVSTATFLISPPQIPWGSDHTLSPLSDPWSSDFATLNVRPGPGIYRQVGCFTCASKSATLSVLRYADCSSPFSFSACDAAWYSQRPQSSHLSCHKCQSSYITWSVEMLLRLTWHFHSGRIRRLPQVRLRPHLAQSDPVEEGPSSTGSLCCLFPFFEAGIFISFHKF